MTTSTPFVKAGRRSAITAAFRSTKTWASALCLGVAMGPMAGQASADPEVIDFGITSGKVVPSENFAVMVTVLGAAITSGGKDQPVTVEFHVDNDDVAPFGQANKALEGNVNDHGAARHYILDEMYESGDAITVTATSWSLLSSTSGTSDSDYDVHHQRNSSDQSPYVKVLRDGDPVPAIKGFEDQSSIAEFVAAYVDTSTNTISLDANQSIYLFELGVTNLSSSAADFQDLVALVTLGESPEALAAQMGLASDLAALFD